MAKKIALFSLLSLGLVALLMISGCGDQPTQSQQLDNTSTLNSTIVQMVLNGERQCQMSLNKCYRGCLSESLETDKNTGITNINSDCSKYSSCTAGCTGGYSECTNAFVKAAGIQEEISEEDIASHLNITLQCIGSFSQCSNRCDMLKEQTNRCPEYVVCTTQCFLYCDECIIENI